MQTAMDEGATALPKSASNRRTLREISNRLLTLSEEDRTLLIDEVARAVCEAQVKMTWTWREERDMVRIERD